MRAVVLLIVAITVVLPVSLTVVLLMPESWKTALRTSVMSGFRSGSAAQSGPAAPQKPPAEPVHKVLKAKMNPVLPVTANMPAVTAPPAPIREPKHFPMQTEVDRGVSRARILAAFGQPTVKATGSDSGRLMEQYYYVDGTSHRRTMLKLIDGHVTLVCTWSEEP